MTMRSGGWRSARLTELYKYQSTYYLYLVLGCGSGKREVRIRGLEN